MKKLFFGSTGCLLLFILIIATSCVQNDDYSVPQDLNSEENKNLNRLLTGSAMEISIAELKLKYNTKYKKPVLIDNDIYIKGYVSSSDKEGNFFKEIYIQDTPENPTAGIKIIVNQVETYNQYNLGREVYIQLQGLYLGEERAGNGVVTIGGSTGTDQFGTTVKRLSESQRAQHLLRSKNTFNILPLVTTISDIDAQHIGIYVHFDNVEFPENYDGQRYFDPTEDFDTVRKLRACSNGINYSHFQLQTSAYAVFKDALLPDGNGSIKGIITKNFDGSLFVMALNSINDVEMQSQKCQLLKLEDLDVLFQENFQSAVDDQDFDFPGWTNFAQKGKVAWTEQFTDDNGYAAFSSAGSGNASNIAWLITPVIVSESSSHRYLHFTAAHRGLKSPKNILEVLISTDYDGQEVIAAEWTLLDAVVPTLSDPEDDFINSGVIDLSTYPGKFYLAFKATGAGAKNSTMTGTFRVDDLKIYSSN